MIRLLVKRNAHLASYTRFCRESKLHSLNNHVRTFKHAAFLMKHINNDDCKDQRRSITEKAEDFMKETRLNHTKMIEKTNKFKTDTVNLSKDLREKTIQRSKDLREKTIQKSKDIQMKTLKKSQDLQNNIKKIIPKDIHENIYTVPNILTFTRLVSAPIVGYLILQGQVTLALALFVYSCITDFLDGFIARRWNLKSVVGSVIDPLADKMLMMICTISLAMTSEIPLYIGTLIIGRDVGLGLAAVVIRYLSLPPPKTFWRYWDFSIPSAEVHPTMISKINTALQMLYLGSMMIKPVFMFYLSDQFGIEPTNVFLNFIQYLEYTVAATTLWSGLSYMFSKTAVKYVRR